MDAMTDENDDLNNGTTWIAVIVVVTNKYWRTAVYLVM